MNRRVLRIAAPVALVVLVLAGYGLYQYVIVADSPDEVTTEAALEQFAEDLEAEAVSADEMTDEVASVDESVVNETAAADESGTSSPAGVEGTWTVDDEFGDFAFENASGSFAGFRVQKELFVGGEQTAVGRSGDVTGSITIADGAVSAGEIIVDMTSLQSDISARESAIKSAVDTGTFPTASFFVGEPSALDLAALDAGETVSAGIIGELTIAGTTNTETIRAEATVVGDGVALIVGTADLTWADYGVDTPNSTAGTVQESGILEVQLVVRLG
ncbi:MAG: YceI family protein [Actinomycetota bacterium]